jgi:hypothetical protein
MMYLLYRKGEKDKRKIYAKKKPVLSAGCSRGFRKNFLTVGLQSESQGGCQTNQTAFHDITSFLPLTLVLRFV